MERSKKKADYTVGLFCIRIILMREGIGASSIPSTSCRINDIQVVGAFQRLLGSGNDAHFGTTVGLDGNLHITLVLFFHGGPFPDHLPFDIRLVYEFVVKLYPVFIP